MGASQCPYHFWVTTVLLWALRRAIRYIAFFSMQLGGKATQLHTEKSNTAAIPRTKNMLLLKQIAVKRLPKGQFLREGWQGKCRWAIPEAGHVYVMAHLHCNEQPGPDVHGRCCTDAHLLGTG